MTKFYVKFHENVVAICDEDLIGKIFDDGKIKLEILPRFYGGELMDEKQIKDLLAKGKNLNLVGAKCIKIALDNKIIKEEHVLYVKGIPHAQVYSI